MAIMRVHSTDLSGTAVVYDGTNPGEIEAFAPDRWRGRGGAVTVLDDDGAERELSPGWAVTRTGPDGITVWDPASFARHMRETA